MDGNELLKRYAMMEGKMAHLDALRIMGTFPPGGGDLCSQARLAFKLHTRVLLAKEMTTGWSDITEEYSRF